MGIRSRNRIWGWRYGKCLWDRKHRKRRIRNGSWKRRWSCFGTIPHHTSYPSGLQCPCRSFDRPGRFDQRASRADQLLRNFSSGRRNDHPSFYLARKRYRSVRYVRPRLHTFQLPGFGRCRIERQRVRPQYMGCRRQAGTIRNRQLHLTGLCGPPELFRSTGIENRRFLLLLPQYGSQFRQTGNIRQIWKHTFAHLYGWPAIQKQICHRTRKHDIRQPEQSRRPQQCQQPPKRRFSLYTDNPDRQTCGQLRWWSGVQPACGL